MPSEMSLHNRFDYLGRSFESVPYLLADADQAIYQIVTSELTQAGPVQIASRKLRAGVPNAFGEEINSKLIEAFARIEEATQSQVDSGQV